MLAVRCSNLVKRYPGRPPVEAVRGLDLEIQVGECFGLLGPNGAGKTTTIEIIEGLLTATSGEVEVLGRSWGRQDDEIRQRIGISLQETRLSDRLTVLETLILFRSFYRDGLNPEDILERVSLGEKKNAWVGKLSGGQQQRLAVACRLADLWRDPADLVFERYLNEGFSGGEKKRNEILQMAVLDPKLAILDETDSGLDIDALRVVANGINGLRGPDRAIVLVTHYQRLLNYVVPDRVHVLSSGRIVKSGGKELAHELESKGYGWIDDPAASAAPGTAAGSR
jgi:ABC-2 type transport system ATP-binding protein